METNVMRNRAHVDQSIVSNLKEVKETIAIQSNNRTARTFGIQDLWNIRRRAKPARARIR